MDSDFISTILKFSLDFLRYDHINKAITTNQIFSIGIFVVLIIVIIVKKKLKKDLN